MLDEKCSKSRKAYAAFCTNVKFTYIFAHEYPRLCLNKKTHFTLLFSDIYRKDKANLDCKAKITPYAYPLFNKAIHDYYCYYLLLYFITSQWCVKTLKILLVSLLRAAQSVDRTFNLILDLKILYSGNIQDV